MPIWPTEPLGHQGVLHLAGDKQLRKKSYVKRVVYTVPVDHVGPYDKAHPDEEWRLTRTSLLLVEAWCKGSWRSSWHRLGAAAAVETPCYSTRRPASAAETLQSPWSFSW